MHAEVVYFSQSGNTRRIASAITLTLDALGFTTDITPLRRARGEKIAKADIIGIGSPCYNSQAPTPMKRFLASLPSLEGKRAFVFATSGGAPGRVLFDLSEGLRQHGADVVAGFLARGKVSHPCPTIFGRFPQRPNGDELERAREFAADLATKMSGNGHNDDAIRWARQEVAEMPRNFYSHIGAFASDEMIRELMPKPHVDENRCHMCRWCALSCPQGNIKMDPYPIVGEKCIRCYRCLTGCPRKTFTIAWNGSEKVMEALYNIELIKRWGDLEPGEEMY